MEIDVREILHHVDHTELRPEATWSDIQKLCDEAIACEAASVCIAPGYVMHAKSHVGSRIPIATVIGFPNGYATTAAKVFEASDAIVNGADELDMVINIGWVKDGRYDEVVKEIKAVKAVAGSRILKVIVETCLLTEEEKIRMCEAVTEAKADYIKTFTGFSKGGATFTDVALFKEHVGENVKIKAAGGIRTLAEADLYMKFGADRLGTSRLIRQYLKEQEQNEREQS